MKARLKHLKAKHNKWYHVTFLPKFNVIAPALIVTCLVIAIAAMTVTYVSKQAQDDAQDTLLTCFQDWTDAQTERSNKIGDQTAVLETEVIAEAEVEADRDIAFQTVLDLIEHRVSDPKLSRDAFKLLAENNAKLLIARDKVKTEREKLQRIRKRFPVPPPPAKFCDVEL
jgi:hypothetical protein